MITGRRTVREILELMVTAYGKEDFHSKGAKVAEGRGAGVGCWGCAAAWKDGFP